MSDLIKPEFPGNSIKSRAANQTEDEPEKPTRKIITTSLVKKKKSWWDKLGESFIGEDKESVGDYILWDVLIPAAKNTISEMVTTGIEMLLFGEARSTGIRRDKSKSIFNYAGVRQQDRFRERAEPIRNRSRHKFDDIIIEHRGEAEEVLSNLVEMIDKYDVVSVADFYDLVGITTDFADNKYGWDNLSRASVSRVRDGYVINLPRPEPLV